MVSLPRLFSPAIGQQKASDTKRAWLPFRLIGCGGGGGGSNAHYLGLTVIVGVMALASN